MVKLTLVQFQSSVSKLIHFQSKSKCNLIDFWIKLKYTKFCQYLKLTNFQKGIVFFIKTEILQIDFWPKSNLIEVFSSLNLEGNKFEDCLKFIDSTKIQPNKGECFHHTSLILCLIFLRSLFLNKHYFIPYFLYRNSKTAYHYCFQSRFLIVSSFFMNVLNIT